MASTFRSDKRHLGDENIIISMDIGTTHSAVSFSHLCRDDYPSVRLVTRWPGQENATGDAKIPTMIAYQDGIARYFGVEARDYKNDDDYEMAYWFKLNLHPESMKESDLPPAYGSSSPRPSQIEIPPLPRRVTLRQIYSDFIKYLYDHTQEFFVESTPNGQNIWDRLESKIIIIFCHPNGWDISQQSFLSDCAVGAGIVKESEVDTRVDFVTEGEASVHYALAHTTSMSWLKTGTLFVVVDAGGSTIDSNLYECKSTEPLRLEEAQRSECVQAGGVFVDRAARAILQKNLATSAKFGTDEFLDLMVDYFEIKTKRLFGGSLSSNSIQFGRNSDNDRAHNILKGRITLTSEEIGSCFDDPITRTVDSCLKLLRERKVHHMLLVGGFGESPYMQQRLRTTFKPKGTEVVTVDQPSKKAAADGAIIWYLKQMVSARAARFTLGTDILRPYDPDDFEHRRRSALKIEHQDGRYYLKVMDNWIEKDSSLENNWELTKLYSYSWKSFPDTNGVFSWGVYAWEGYGPALWFEDELGKHSIALSRRNPLPKMRRICTVKAERKQLVSAFETKTGPQGKYWSVTFQVVVKFGGTRLRAWMKWKDEWGNAREGPASIIPGTSF
ncbi:hypothetical protein CPB86DRAFT_876888 [Serendipita vermifera]|nr:hypothetical protein CPB86DRAFT_876888 [Serendipita vermifera]